MPQWCVYGRAGSHAIDFWSTTRNLEAITRESSDEQRRGAAVLLTFGLPCAILKQAYMRESSHRLCRRCRGVLLILVNHVQS